MYFVLIILLIFLLHTNLTIVARFSSNFDHQSITIRPNKKYVHNNPPPSSTSTRRKPSIGNNTGAPRSGGSRHSSVFATQDQLCARARAMRVQCFKYEITRYASVVCRIVAWKEMHGSGGWEGGREEAAERFVVCRDVTQLPT